MGGDTFYRNVNKALREGSPRFNMYADILTRAITYLANHPDRAKDPPQVVYRGIGFDLATYRSMERGKFEKINDNLQFSSFSETEMVGKKFATDWIHRGSPVPFLMKMVDGHKCNMAYLGPYGLANETEWLCPPGQKFRTVGTAQIDVTITGPKYSGRGTIHTMTPI